MKKTLLFGFVCFAILEISFGGCADNSQSNAYNNPNPPPPNTFSMAGMSFNPTSMTVPKGTTITWKNDDGVLHTSISDSSGVWDTGDVAPGNSKSTTFTSAGTFRFHCKYHGTMGMTGTITVN